jgi:glycosyltransferase involved in cell wall biosynthesis
VSRRRSGGLTVNARFLTQRLTGVQRYAIEISRRLKAMRSDIRFVAPTGVIHTAIARELAVETFGRLHGHAWEQLELPHHLYGTGLINLCNAAPIAVARQIVTIHDAAPFAVPEAYSRAFTLWYRVMTRRLGSRAAGIVTVSHFSAGELSRYLGVAPGRIDVTPLGSEHVHAIPADETIIARHRLGDRPFLLAVGSHSPHKNFAALVRAAERLGDVPFRVVMAGGADPRVHASVPEALASSHVAHVGGVSDGELRALYERAAGYIHPAYYEGFGLPPLEAMALGCPVLTSQAASLPEVCGDAADYFDPFDADAIVAAIRGFMADDVRRVDLAAAGRVRATQFSWDSCARALLAVADARLS